jgi:hypothetical protein
MMLRAAFVPMTWVTSGISAEALRTLIVLSVYADRSTGECWPSNRQLMDDLERSERQIRRHIGEIESAGLISIQNRDARDRKFRIESEDWFKLPNRKQRPNPDTNDRVSEPETRTFLTETRTEMTGSGNGTRTFLVENPDIFGREPGHFCPGPNKNYIQRTYPGTYSSSGSISEESKPDEPATTTTTTPIQNLEPFESGTPAPLPAIRNAVEPHRPKMVELQPTIFRPETRDRIMAVLGHDGEQFARKVTQEQADAGFADWVLAESEGNRTPARLAFHLLKTAWRPGWVNPQDAETARLEEMAEMMRNLK